MRIGVAGLGPAGAYLLRLLSNDGFDVTGFDPKPEGFYVPCGYATNENRIKPPLSRTGVEFSDYVYSRADKVLFSGERTRELEFESAGLCTFDKNRLLRDLIDGLRWHRSTLKGEFDLIIDATGIARAHLPVVPDFRMHTLEYLSEGDFGGQFRFRYFSKGTGYFWIFPLGSKYHIGAGADTFDRLRTSLQGYEHSKTVSRDIRLKPLFNSLSSGNVIGVGEAIGTVSPITGEGIVPSIISSGILYDAIKRNSSIEQIEKYYAHTIAEKFQRYDRLFRLLSDVRNGRMLSLRNMFSIGAVKEDLQEFGISFRVLGTLKALLGR